ncbi:MAG: SGNH/GDSL hydrolase family protein, partial [Candidatus Omnitrophica bacterium]|nr:SGNH/GDSL hydrolase family protein [Candidatus Omnitrophota bacterium]
DFRGRGWKQTKYFISSLKNLVENDGAQFMMFYIPIEAQLDLETYGQNGRMFFGETKQGTYINERLKEFAEAENILFLDLLEPFNARANEELYLNWDGHLTVSGHRVLAEELADFMDKELF